MLAGMVMAFSSAFASLPRLVLIYALFPTSSSHFSLMVSMPALSLRYVLFE
jgi:hypothetical protein